MTNQELKLLINGGISSFKELNQINLFDLSLTLLRNRLGRLLKDEEKEFIFELNKAQIITALKEIDRVFDNRLKQYKCYACGSKGVVDDGLCSKCLELKAKGIYDLEEFYKYARGFNNATLDEIIAYYKERVELNGGIE